MEELIRRLMDEIESVQKTKEQVEVYSHHYKELVKIELVLATALEDITSNCFPELMRIERSIKGVNDEKEKIKKQFTQAKSEKILAE